MPIPSSLSRLPLVHGSSILSVHYGTRHSCQNNGGRIKTSSFSLMCHTDGLALQVSGLSVIHNSMEYRQQVQERCVTLTWHNNILFRQPSPVPRIRLPTKPSDYGINWHPLRGASQSPLTHSCTLCQCPCYSQIKQSCICRNLITAVTGQMLAKLVQNTQWCTHDYDQINLRVISLQIILYRHYGMLEEGERCRQSLTSVHCPWFCTMMMTQGSDLLSVSRSSRALQETRSSTLDTHAEGTPVSAAAGEVASGESLILDQEGWWWWCGPARDEKLRFV